jgi:hypothetical protein
MKVNNEIYETQGHGWWVNDAGFGFSSLRLCLTLWGTQSKHLLSLASVGA